VICPECGARQRRQAISVRCASCRHRVPVTLSICPHCGRNVRPAGPRWGIWLAVAALLVLVVLWSLNKLPVERVGQEVAGIRSRVSSLVQVLGPAPTATQTVAVPQLLARTTPIAPPTVTAAEMSSPNETEMALPVDTGEDEAPAVETVPVAPEPRAGVETPAADAQATAAVATPAPTATPTLAPSPTATAVPPTPTAVPPTATATRAAAGAGSTYRVRSGDTLSGIAQRFNITLQALLTANRIPVNATLRIGQDLIIPGAGVPPTPTAPPKPRATPTATRPALPPTPAPYLDAPVLTGPGDQASYRGDKAQVFLSWEAVPGMIADDRYQVVIRWMEQGALQEKSDVFTTATSIQASPWLWGRADQPERRYQWYVRPVRLSTDGQGVEVVIPLGPPSPTRTFYWN
jgi:LysM repeat protein